jgi:hypothetical protein
MKTDERVIKILEELKDFFKSRNVTGWIEKTKYSIKKIKGGEDRIESILDDFVGAGMGSLTDLYISSSNGHLLKQSEKEENAELMRLTEQLLLIKYAVKGR